MTRVRIAAVLIFLASLTVAVLIVTDAVPQLRGPAPTTDVWHWPYLQRPIVRWWPAMLFAGLLAIAGVWWVAHQPDRAWPVAIIVALTLGLQLSLIYADRPAIGAELVDRTLSKDTSGYAAVAGEIDALSPALRAYPQLMAGFDNEHARTHPPGLVAAFWLGDRAFRLWPALAEWAGAPVRLWRCTDLWVLSRPPSTAAGLLVGSWLPVLAAALVPLAAYGVARRLLRGAAVALAAVLAATIPALLVFSPTPDQLFALLSLVSLWLVLKGLARRSPLWLFAAGVVLSLMTLLSVGNAAWAGLVGLYALLSLWQRDRTLPERLFGLGALGTGLLSLWLIYWAVWGVPPWAILDAGLDQHYQLVTSQRDYLTWLAYNPLDLLLFAGLSVVVGWGGLTLAALLRRNWRCSEAGLLALLLTAVLLVLALSGSTRGEVGRLWLVFMPLAAVLAGGGWATVAGSVSLVRPPQRSDRALRFSRLNVALIITAQLLLALAIGLAWRPLQAIILPVERPLMAASPANLTPLDITFRDPRGQSLALTGFAGTGPAAPGETVDLTLAWTGAGPTLDPVTVFVHFIDSQGALVAQQDNWPVGGAWPTTCWRPGESIFDPYAVALPPDLPAGTYQVLVGAYGPDGTRLLTPSGQDAAAVGRITVGP